MRLASCGSFTRLIIDERRSVRSIVMQLRQLGIRSARGRWTNQQVLRVLTGGYDGTRFFNRHAVQPDGQRRVRERADWIAVTVPPIVTAEQTEAARTQLNRNRLTRVGRPPLRVLPAARPARLLDVWSALPRVQDVRPAPVLPSEQRAVACMLIVPPRVHGRCALEMHVRETIAAALADPAVLRRGVEAYELRRGATAVELRSRVAHLAKQIEKIRTDEWRLIALVVGDREQQEIVESKLRELAQRRGALAGQLRDAEAEVARQGAATPAPQRIEAVCARARLGLGKLDREGWRAFTMRAGGRSTCASGSAP